MNRETIIQMAREAGLAEVTDTAESLPADYVEALAKLCAMAVAKEREECAKVCESFRDVREEARAALRVADALESGDQDRMLSALGHDSDVRLYHSGLDKSAAAIRARGEA
jgi:uncharacterized protein YqfA (UPF0365 family)